MEWNIGMDFYEKMEELFPPVLNNEFHNFIKNDGNGNFKILSMRCNCQAVL